MRPAKLESRRVAVDLGGEGVEETTVSLQQSHVSMPFVSVTLEPEDSATILARTTARVTQLSTAGVTIEFSSKFRGYLHLHAVSEL